MTPPAAIDGAEFRERDLERFWGKVLIPIEGCWLWTANRYQSGTGYGCFYFNRRRHGAHRISWTLHNGAIPAGLHVLHKCDNKQCLNPAHLFLGTPSDNAKDAFKKGLGGNQRLTVEDVYGIRSAFKSGETRREIANRLHVSKSQVERIINGKQWSFV